MDNFLKISGPILTFTQIDKSPSLNFVAHHTPILFFIWVSFIYRKD